MDQPNPKLRLAAMAATFIALLAISIPFVWEHDVEADPAGEPALVASHEAEDGVPASDGGACMANAKPANLDFTINDMDGRPVTFSDHKGKVILLNFWATWCGPCKAEIPGFVELQAEYPDDLVVLGYSIDDTAAQARAFAEQYKINYPVLLGEGKEDVQNAYGPIWGIPASFLISRDGRVCKRHLGIAPKAVFEREIKALL